MKAAQLASSEKRFLKCESERALAIDRRPATPGESDHSKHNM